ncbi:MAG: hypothetical protein FWD39_06105 [Clostridiales bacterium]|nr:hypothetical protein [Clostridiales bacterium]
MLPQHIKEVFFRMLLREMALEDFEEWLYENKELEMIIASDDYLDLISLNYRKRSAEYELRKLLMKQLDPGEVETYELLGLLRKAKKQPPDLAFVLMQFYDLYCDGYYFLDILGLEYGLTVTVPPNANSWNELSEKQQKDLLSGFSPKLEEEIDRIIACLENKTIILTGETNDCSRRLCYVDLRPRGLGKILVNFKQKILNQWRKHFGRSF